ncbi:MAG: hypothetical protein R3326_02785 [Gemmatimonadota bacterium]|nr:hypothetical protein [Gemmatimonadota bacterium]
MNLKGPLTGGVVAAGLSLLILWMIGRLGAGEARILLESTQPTVRFLCSTTAAASATILALMLTLLGLSETPEEEDREFHSHHFERIRRISLFSTICLTASIFVLLLLVVPLRESDNVPVVSYTILYYVILGTASMLGGLMIAIMLMLYNAIVGLVHMAHPEADSHLVREVGDGKDDEGAEKDREAEREDGSERSEAER